MRLMSLSLTAFVVKVLARLLRGLLIRLLSYCVSAQVAPSLDCYLATELQETLRICDVDVSYPARA
jgi:hypothetical protein